MNPNEQPPRKLTRGQKWAIAIGVLVALGLVGGIMDQFGLLPDDEPVAAAPADATPSPEPDASPSEVDEVAEAREDLGYPDELTGADRDAYLDAIEAVDAGFRFPTDDALIARAGDLCVELQGDGEDAALTRVEMIWVHEDGSAPSAEHAQALLDVVKTHACV